MAKRPALEKFLAGPGKAQYPWIDKPDNKFPVENPKPVYKVNLILDGESEKTTALIEKLTAVRDAKLDEVMAELNEKVASATGSAKAKAKAKLAAIEVSPVYEDDYDDEGEPNGGIVIKCKLNGEVKGKDGVYTQSPNIFDCAKPPQPLTGVNIWAGSILKVSGDIVPYFMESTNTVGVSLRMKGVQVIELVSGGGKDAASYGFDGEDGGFVAPEHAGASDFDDADDDDDGGDDDF